MYDGMFGTSGDEWRKKRRALTPAFSSHKMKLVRFKLYYFSKLQLLYLCKTEYYGWKFWCELFWWITVIIEIMAFS